MVRLAKYGHNKVVTGSQDAGKQVSKNEWNDGHNELGMFGHGTVTTLTIATGAIVPINSMHIVDGQGASDDNLDNLTVTETSDRDELWLIKGGQVITVRDNSVSSGNIFLLNGSTSILDTNKPMRLIRSGTNWYEFGGAGSGIFLDSNFLIQDDGDVSKEWDTQLSGATTSTKTTLAFSQTLNRTITYPDATDTLVGKATTDVFTNKTFDANGVGNSITNIENADLASGVFSNITGLGAQSQTLDMNTQILQFVDANQTITNNGGNLFYDVADGQVHLWRINNVTKMQLSATALAMQGNAVLQVGFLTSFAADPSDAGTIRLGNAQSIDWRNAGNTANFGITGNASDQIAIDADFNIQGNQIINTGTLTLPTSTDTLVGKATTDVFTNKSYDLGGVGNVLTGSVAEFNTALQTETFTYVGVGNAWGTPNQNIAATGKWQEGGVNISPIGTQDVWIPASALWASTTNGATGLTQRELATNDVDIQTWDFTSTTADEHTQFTWAPPRNWNEGTITVRFYWTATGGSAGNVRWGAQARANGDNDALDQAWGTIQEVTDAWIANDDVHISAATPTIVIGGTPAAEDVVQFRILRSGSDAADTFATTAGLLGIRIEYTLDAATST